jgi:hypothetical protein
MPNSHEGSYALKKKSFGAEEWLKQQSICLRSVRSRVQTPVLPKKII